MKEVKIYDPKNALKIAKIIRAFNQDSEDDTIPFWQDMNLRITAFEDQTFEATINLEDCFATIRLKENHYSFEEIECLISALTYIRDCLNGEDGKES